MPLTKSCRSVTNGVAIEVSLLDGSGCAADFSSEHKTFAVMPGPFSVKAILTVHAPALRQYCVLAGQRISFHLYVDGQHVNGQCVFLYGQQLVHVMDYKLVDKTGRCEKHALLFEKPGVDARGGAAVAGEAGTIKLTCSQVTVTGEYPISQHGLFGGPVAPKASGRSQGDKKFFMDQGLTFRTGDMKGIQNGNWVTACPVLGGFDVTVKVKYDMSDYLRLRGVLPRDVSPPPNPAPKRLRCQPTAASQRAAAIAVKQEPGVVDLTQSSSVAGPSRSRARIIGPIDLTND